jgi:hypothetical protein
MPPDEVVAPPGPAPTANGSTPPVPPPAAASEPGEPPKPREVSAFARRRHALSAKAAQLAEREKAADARIKAAEEKAAAAEKKALEEQAKREAWEKAPLEQATKAGRNLDELISQGIAGNTPEKVAADALARVEALQKQIADREKAEADRQQQERTRAAQQQIQVERNAFIQAVAKAPEKYRYIHSEFDINTLAAHVATFDDWARGEGKAYSFDQVAEYLDGVAKKLYEQRRPLRRAIEEPDPAAEPRALAPPGRDPRGNGSESRTKPKSGSRVLSEEEKIQEELAQLRRGIEADRIAAAKSAK